jgi:hypothetical protein
MPAGGVVRAEVFIRMSLQEDGGPNRNFLTYLLRDKAISMQFLMDVGLLRSKVQCNTRGRGKMWSAEPTIPEGFRWPYRKKVVGVMCSESRCQTAPAQHVCCSGLGAVPFFETHEGWVWF